MVDSLPARFDRAAEAYDEYLSSPLGKLRDDLAWHWLSRALQARPGPLSAIDVGCGPGHFAMRLAGAGHRVCLLDPSSQMLAHARARADAQPADIRARLTYCETGVEEFVKSSSSSPFDLVLAHTVVEYLPGPGSALALLVGLLRPQGLFSLVFANRDAEPLRRAVIERQSEGVSGALEADEFPETLFGAQRRMFVPAHVRLQLQELGMAVIAERGIRVFSDYIVDGETTQDEIASIYNLEVAAADLFPWKYIARYVHLMARKT